MYTVTVWSGLNTPMSNFKSLQEARAYVKHMIATNNNLNTNNFTIANTKINRWEEVEPKPRPSLWIQFLQFIHDIRHN